MTKLYQATAATLLLTLFFMINGPSAHGQPGQITIDRVAMMPDEPSPFNVRDWREVSRQYDAFIYNEQLSGQYLPLVFIHNNGINYPQQQSYGLDSYVGTFSVDAGEAINVLPSLVGATLVGVDKRDQYGRDWLLLSQDYFNKANGEMIYLNNRGGSSGNDWWYDLMPNVFFYQLYDLYPPWGESEFQFVSVADRFLEAVRAMGGSDTPWNMASMNYRAWDFVEMAPNTQGVIEPEAAGAYGWVLYHAYTQTGNKEYLKGAEWSIEFLNQLQTNPSYELQLPYGTYAAARMNAELGTTYDIEKMINWSFNRGPLRGWGTIVGEWGGFDVSGLVGEANDNGNDYAFLMNGMQQAGALAPMVRYDKRFARAVGKWILNLANASRLFYPGFLPGSFQDSEQWSETYDPQRVIGHEAMREVFNGISPFSTGDAIGGGWAATNLALYGCSSVGYLGAIVSETDVDKILQIDLLKTDFFGDEAYPTYLYFNPYSLEQTLTLEVGDVPVDVYDALTETFLQAGVSQTTGITIPPGEARLIVLTPAGGSVSYEQHKMLVDGVVVDYRQSAVAYNYPPRIQALATESPEVEVGTSITVYGTAFDPDDNDLTYEWEATGGILTGQEGTVEWQAPETEGAYEITLTVSDGAGNTDTDTLTLAVVAEINVAPQIIDLMKDRTYVEPGGTLGLSCEASDANEDDLTYDWSADAGEIQGAGSEVAWISPGVEGIYTISVTVSDGEGGEAQASTAMLVRIFTAGAGDLIAYYPFTGNADDHSGNELHGVRNGALPAADVNGVFGQAYRFDGINDNIQVDNVPLLNFTEAVTVTAWMQPTLLPNNEVFIVSHGSWQNRWKISVIPDHRVRWTINSSAGPIGDLDSETVLEVDSFYHIGATYDGELMALYLNGRLHSYRPFSGPIRATSLDLLVGQMLPGDAGFNFRGVIDEVKIFDYALIPEEMENEYETLLTDTDDPAVTGDAPGLNVFPNPAGDRLYVRYPAGEMEGRLILYNAWGQPLRRWTTGGLAAGAPLRIDLHDLPPGLYVLGLETDAGYRATEFIKR